MKAFYKNSDHLRKLLKEGGRLNLLNEDEIEVEEKEYSKHLEEARQQHPELSEDELEARAVYRTLPKTSIPKATRNNLNTLASEILSYQLQEIRTRVEDRPKEEKYRKELNDRFLDIRKAISVEADSTNAAIQDLTQDMVKVTEEIKGGIAGVKETVRVCSGAVKESMDAYHNGVTDYVTEESKNLTLLRSEVAYLKFGLDILKKIGIGILAALAILILLTIFAGKAHAQNAVRPAIIVSSCGTVPASYPTTVGGVAPLTVDTTGKECAGVSVVATVGTSGLASDTNQTNGSQLTQIVDAGGDAVTVTGGKLDVNAVVSIPGSLSVSTTLGSSGTVTVVGSASSGTTATFSPVRIGGTDGLGNVRNILTDSIGLMGTYNASISQTSLGPPSYGTFIAGASTGIGGLVGVQVNDTGVVRIDPSGTTTQPVSGTVTVTDGAGALNVIVDSGTTTVTQGTGTNLHTVVDSGTITAVTSITNPVTVTDGAGALNVIVDSGAVNATVVNTAGSPVIATIQSGGIGAAVTAAGALKVDGSAVTQPVSGTVTVTDGAGALNVIVDSGTTTVTQATGTNLHTVVDSGTITAVTAITNALPAGTNNIGDVDIVTMPNVTLTAGQTVNANFLSANIAENLTQLNGTTVDTNSGNKSAGTLRVVMATDQPNLTTALNVNCTAGCTPGGSFADNSAFTVGSTAISNSGGVFNDALTDLAAGNAAAQRITEQRAAHINLRDSNGLEIGTALNPVAVKMIPTPQLPTTATSAVTGTQILGTFNRPVQTTNDALNVNITNAVDPCSGPKGSIPISQATSAVLLTQNPGRVYICGMLIVGADAENLSLVEGTGSVCGTNTAAILGGTTAATGTNLAANGGFNMNIELVQKNPGYDVCLLQSGTGRVAGALSYVIR